MKIKPGDNIIALSSSGLHATGFSLIQKIIDQHRISLDVSFGVQTLGEVLITPSKNYGPAIFPLIQQDLIHVYTHIMNGGILENLLRVLSKEEGVRPLIDLNSFELPPIFAWIKETGPVSDEEMLRTFNCGVGMILIVSQQNTEPVLNHLEELGEHAWILGKIMAVEPSNKPIVECIGHLS